MRKNHLLWLVSLGTVFCVLVLLSVLRPPSQTAAFQSVAPAVDSTVTSTVYLPAVAKTYSPRAPVFPNCRLGVSASNYQLNEYELIPNFGVGLYQDFGTRFTSSLPPQMAGAEHVQMLRISQTRLNDPVDKNAPITTCGPDYGYQINRPLHDNAGGLGPLVANRRGALWIVGNEPDRRIAQDDVCPQQYAEAYHDVYHFIKQRDPSAQIAVAGLVQVSPGRLQYLDIVYDTYLQRYGQAMPVDVWTMHIYILSETSNGDSHIAVGTDPAVAFSLNFECGKPNSVCYAEHDDINIFKQQVRMMRQWMKNRGYQNTPLLLTEFGINLPYHYYGVCSDQYCSANPPSGNGCFCDTNGETFHPQRVADYAQATFAYLLEAKDPSLGYALDNNRLVQQFIWFAVEVQGAGQASNLITSTATSYALTRPGEWWNSYVQTLPKALNLFPSRVPGGAGRSPDGVSPVTVTLTAEVRNNGNATVGGPVTVMFYRNAALTQAIGSATFTDLGGCARASTVVTTTWANLPTGAHRFWVMVDSSHVVAETSETDNVIEAVVIINGYEIYLPLVTKK